MGQYNWYQFYNEAVRYYNEHGDINIPTDYITKDGLKLGRWLLYQRYNYRNGILSESKAKYLENLNINWDTVDANWYIKYNLLKDYFNKNGNINIPHNYKCKDGYALGKWLCQQRTAYNKKKLRKDKIKALEELNIIWDVRKEKWDFFYYKLEEYYNEHGNIEIPASYVTEDDIKLGRWLSIQKRAYKGLISSRLDKNQTMLLNDLNIEWAHCDTMLLNQPIKHGNKRQYQKILLKRMGNILTDLSYEIDGNIVDISKQKDIEKEILKRMWR